MINKKYQIILADPPWRYDFSKDDSDTIENHYPTMDVEDICKIQVPSDENAVLYLWATAPKLREALRVMESWGFEYKTHAVWDKGWVGMGYWFRGQHELLLVGVKGKFSPPEQEQRISSIIKENKSEHSKKPELIKQLIREWYPIKSKLEMFARQNKEGLFEKGKPFEVWGNEVKSDIIL